MNICYVANSRFPSERAHMTQIVQMCNAFFEHGHQVTLLVTNRKTHILETPEIFFGVPILFKISRITVPDIAGNAIHIPILLRPLLFMIQRFVFAFRSAQYIHQNKFDYVYGRDEWILWILTKLITLPITWESHEAKFSRIAMKLIKYTRKLVVISEGIRDFYKVHGVEEEMMLVAHDAVDNRFFTPHISTEEARARLGITTIKSVVMYIGGLESWKGAETLCRSAVGQNIFEVYIIGGKPSEVTAYMKRYPSVHFLGNRPYRELPEHQQSADVLVIPNTATVSLSSEYTSPLKLFTYMTAQKPIVASRIPSITNVLTDEECFFVDADDAQVLQQTIISVINNTEQGIKKAEHAYQKSMEYTWYKRTQHILHFLDIM